MCVAELICDVTHSLGLIVNINRVLCIMDIKSKIGNRIKELRESKKISQKDLAYTADIDRSYIASVESGKRNISIVNIERIASALGVNLKEFFDDDGFDNHTTSSR